MPQNLEVTNVSNIKEKFHITKRKRVSNFDTGEMDFTYLISPYYEADIKLKE